MSTLVQIDDAVQHPGVMRAERAWQALRPLMARIGRGSSLLLAAIVSAVLVVANQVVDTWADGHLLMAWILMWAIAFTALALLALPARRAAHRLRQALRAWREHRRQAAADRQMLEVARSDFRVMADISWAMGADAVRDIRDYY